MFNKTKVDHYIDLLGERIIGYIPNLFMAIGILVLGLIAIKLIRNFITRIITARPEHDPTLLKFILDVSSWGLRILLFVSIIAQLGIETTSFAAIIGAGAVAIGLSLQGSLSNFAGGLLIILFKPFRVGDYIEAQGQSGTVSSIQIFSTRLITPNNQVVYLPNGTLSNNTIKNYSQEPERRAEITLDMGYNSDLKKVKDIVFSVIKYDQRILTQPAPAIEVRALTDTSVTIAVYFWTKRENYGGAVSDFYENIKPALNQPGIEFPPHQELSLKYPENKKDGQQ